MPTPEQIAAYEAQTAAEQAARIANTASIIDKARQSLPVNQSFLNSAATRATSIASALTTANSGKTATVTTIAQAQTQIRAIYTLLATVITGVQTLNTQMEALTRQNNGQTRVIISELNGTLTDV